MISTIFAGRKKRAVMVVKRRIVRPAPVVEIPEPECVVSVASRTPLADEVHRMLASQPLAFPKILM